VIRRLFKGILMIFYKRWVRKPKISIQPLCPELASTQHELVVMQYHSSKSHGRRSWGVHCLLNTSTSDWTLDIDKCYENILWGLSLRRDWNKCQDLETHVKSFPWRCEIYLCAGKCQKRHEEASSSSHVKGYTSCTTYQNSAPTVKGFI